MPKRHVNSYSNDHRTIIIVVIVAVVAFGLGYIVARAKYKAQLKTTYNMVIERDGKISELNTKLNNALSQLKLNDSNR